MKTTGILALASLAFACLACGNPRNTPVEEAVPVPDVYFISEISPESLVRIYEALDFPAEGSVAVKISTGEAGGENYLKPALISALVDKVNGTIVECNTAYGGSRGTTEAHRRTIAAHGFDAIAKVDIMDEEGDIHIPVQDTSFLKYDIVGSHLPNYDFMINLAHFKGHAMGGFGGVLKNQSIGVASSAGKAYIHSAGKTEDLEKVWTPEYLAEGPSQDDFLKSMAAAAQAVDTYFNCNIIYINVMNNMSVDCDCDSNPDEPRLKDKGIVASLDPVACDQAALDMVFGQEGDPAGGDDPQPLRDRINRQHGTYITEYAESIGLGSRKYNLITLDKQ